MKFDVDGKMVEAMEWRQGMNLTATKIWNGCAWRSRRTTSSRASDRRSTSLEANPKAQARVVILTIRTQALGRLLCLVIAILMMAAPAVAQPPSPDSDREQAVAQSPGGDDGRLRSGA